jgi:E3 ubiquitin-protein ligase DOA10
MEESTHNQDATSSTREDSKETKNIVHEKADDLETMKEPVVLPPMTFKRFMALLSLVWLITTSATPILFITAVLCKLPLPFRADFSLYY